LLLDEASHHSALLQHLNKVNKVTSFDGYDANIMLLVEINNTKVWY